MNITTPKKKKRNEKIKRDFERIYIKGMFKSFVYKQLGEKYGLCEAAIQKIVTNAYPAKT